MKSSIQPQVQRSLAAIVITDAVGFSKRMSKDEDTALTIINRDLQLITDLCIAFEGKILKTTGDGVLMYFISGVHAASCAIEIQKKFASFAQNNSTPEHFTHRIGVHLGDIFFNQDDMMGTSVNIAARLEAEARPGAICMSQVVYEVVKYRLNIDAVYAGELSLKNIEQSVSAYHVWPPEIAPQKSTEQFSEAIFSLVTPLNTALKVFSSHPQNHRIKKLLYATHCGVWESNPKILKSISLKLLVESLTSRNTNSAECEASLSSVIKTLSQPDRYRQVASIILENIRDFYVEEGSEDQTFAGSSFYPDSIDCYSETGIEPSNFNKLLSSESVRARSAAHPIELPATQREPTKMWNSLTSILRSLSSSKAHEPVSQTIFRNLKEFQVESTDGSPIKIDHSSQLESILKKQRLDKSNLHREIANQLSSSKDNIRIKQLLYCVVCGQWENHIDRIQAIPMLSLVQGLDQKVDSLESLKEQLPEILGRIECRTVYGLAADEILREVRQLYSRMSMPDANHLYFRRGRLQLEGNYKEVRQLSR